MCQLPIDICDTENIVRVILCPAHVKVKGDSKTLKPAAFRSRANIDEVSIIRQTYMSCDFCKQKGLSIQKPPMASYDGLAVIKAMAVRESGSSVQDSREEYCGHAHISHGVVLEANELLLSQQNLLVTERCRTLLRSTKYYPDPNPLAPTWTGPDF